MVVIVTGPAEADLEHTADYIAAHNPVRALTFVRELRGKCEALADAPRAYPLVPRYEHFSIRQRPYGDYLIFYRVGVDAIDIVHILHGARNYEPILFPEE
jgi:toxin ParE1/3/4